MFHVRSAEKPLNGRNTLHRITSKVGFTVHEAHYFWSEDDRKRDRKKERKQNEVESTWNLERRKSERQKSWQYGIGLEGL